MRASEVLKLLRLQGVAEVPHVSECACTDVRQTREPNGAFRYGLSRRVV